MKIVCMKQKYGFLLFILLSSFLSFAANPGGSKAARPIGKAGDEMYRDPAFKKFANAFLNGLFDYHLAHQTPAIQKSPGGFIAAVRESDQEEQTVARIYKSYGADLEVAMECKNRMDNAFLGLFSRFPELLQAAEEDAWATVSEQIGNGLRERDDKEWLAIQQGVVMKLENSLAVGRIGGSSAGRHLAMYAMSHVPFLFKLSIDEVWVCALRAMGMGGGTIFSIGKLQEMALKEGMQAVVGTVSKWLAKRAGWIGMFVTLADFGSCVYAESQD